MASNADALPAELGGRFHSDVVLKRDHLSTIERGTFMTADGPVPAVLRRIDQTPIWTRPVAMAFLKREARALGVAGNLGVAPKLLMLGRMVIVRGWLDGLPLQLAKPKGDAHYFTSAKAALRVIHRRGLTHNDLAKQPNWLRSPEGSAILTDFQLATLFPRRGRTFRMFAYEDLRHLLKHKRRYCGDLLTATERRILDRKMLPARVWMATGKPVYNMITRGILHYSDTEGGGRRLSLDAPAIAARLRQDSRVRDVAIVTYADRRRGVALYAFVEAVGATAGDLRKVLAQDAGPIAPEMLQVVDTLPRIASGEVRTEILKIIATNQIDALDAIVHSAEERRVVDQLLAGHFNLLDRPAREFAAPPAT